MKKKIMVVTLGAMLFALTVPAEAQPLRTVRIGYLGSSSSLTGGEKDFVEELRRRGWIEGQNLVIDRRYWENHVDRLLVLAAELVRLKADIIVTNTGTAAQAAKKATDIIPIVMAARSFSTRSAMFRRNYKPSSCASFRSASSSGLGVFYPFPSMSGS